MGEERCDLLGFVEELEKVNKYYRKSGDTIGWLRGYEEDRIQTMND